MNRTPFYFNSNNSAIVSWLNYLILAVDLMRFLRPASDKACLWIHPPYFTFTMLHPMASTDIRLSGTYNALLLQKLLSSDKSGQDNCCGVQSLQFYCRWFTHFSVLELGFDNVKFPLYYCFSMSMVDVTFLYYLFLNRLFTVLIISCSYLFGSPFHTHCPAGDSLPARHSHTKRTFFFLVTI